MIQVKNITELFDLSVTEATHPLGENRAALLPKGVIAENFLSFKNNVEEIETCLT